ncbi:hypothetical protein LZ686_17295 [Paracoccus sp. NFXS7]|uniref:hypothetical protein n=1 Tax=Paracoccus sp. NFXS7 TaxID=2908653 RepID=UPI0032DF4463
MPKALTISTRNERNEPVMIDCLQDNEAEENAQDADADGSATVGDQGARYRVSDTGQSVTRIDAGKYRIDETAETLIEV